MKKMPMVSMMVALAFVVAGCDSREAKEKAANKEYSQKARDYIADNPANYGSGKQLFNPASPPNKKDEAKK